MNYLLKQFTIGAFIFIFIYWYQYKDDKKHNYKRNSLYDKIKLPLLIVVLIGLLFNLIHYEKTVDIVFNPKDLSSQQIFTELPDF